MNQKQQYYHFDENRGEVSNAVVKPVFDRLKKNGC